MATNTFQTRIQLKKDTDANWRAADPVLLNGEVVYVETNAGEIRQKIGDGSKKYSQLAFLDEILRNQIPAKISDLTNDQYLIAKFTLGSTNSCDKTIAELITAANEGKIAVATSGNDLYSAVDRWTDGIQFARLYYDSDNDKYQIQTIYYYVENSQSVISVETTDLGGSSDAVLYTEQTLTEGQKAQALNNLGISGQVTAGKILNPTNTTDLVQYAAFQAAIPMVRTLGITGASGGQVPLIKQVDSDGVPTEYSVMTPLGQGDADDLYLSLSGGKMNGAINMNNKNITNCSSLSMGVGTTVLKGGNTQTSGTIYVYNANDELGTVCASTINANTLTNVISISSAVNGDNKGIINFNSAKLTKLADPTDAQDAATKNYVDTTIKDYGVYYLKINKNSGSYQLSYDGDFTAYSEVISAANKAQPIYCYDETTGHKFPLSIVSVPTSLDSGADIKLTGLYGKAIWNIAFNALAEQEITQESFIRQSEIVSSLSSSSTDTEVPSAKCVYEVLAKVNELLGKM